MVCPYCEGSSQVINSRSRYHNQRVWRRRKCTTCKAVWTTDEAYDLANTHRVSKPSKKHPEPFSRDKLLLSIHDALRHKKDAQEVSGHLTDTIISQVLARKEAIISIDVLKAFTADVLNRYDTVAGNYYKARYNV